MARTVTKTGRVHYNTKPDPKGVLYLRDLDPKMKKDYKAWCAANGVSMTDAFAIMMEMVTSDKQTWVVNRAKKRGIVQ